MFKEIKSEGEFNSYCDGILKEKLDYILSKSFAKINPKDYQDFDIEKYPNEMIPLYEYMIEWVGLNDYWWFLDNEEVIFLIYEED